MGQVARPRISVFIALFVCGSVLGILFGYFIGKYNIEKFVNACWCSSESKALYTKFYFLEVLTEDYEKGIQDLEEEIDISMSRFPKCFEHISSEEKKLIIETLSKIKKHRSRYPHIPIKPLEQDVDNALKLVP